jgi:hypothetical protein
MTGFAFEFFYFVSNSLLSFCGLMTLSTRNIFMFSIEFESSFIMIEFIGVPILGCMAFYTIGNTVLLKLLIVFIAMTITAASR